MTSLKGNDLNFFLNRDDNQSERIKSQHRGERRMRKETYLFASMVLGVLMVTSGCATNKRHSRDVTNLQNQIASLQGDVARLDQSLKDTESALGSAQGRSAGSGSALAQFTQGSVYRTPSGFELPAASIQQALKNAGYYQGAVDGKVGSKTKQALKSFQRDNGLDADGVCGKQTWARLQQFA